ncbi:mannose-1-phosphate guanylyltransferase [Verrucomicrobiota bacterium]
MLDKAYAVVLAGGRGERFWPLSTGRSPKQFLTLFGGRPLVAAAVERVSCLIPPERVIIITSEALIDQTVAAVPGLPRENVIGEPFGRDTAAACALGTAIVEARCPGGALCVLTADHVIGEAERFLNTLRESLAAALSSEVLITMGIRPASASTGFGYIEAGEEVECREGVRFRRAERFVEKPDRATAEKYVAAGTYFWNSGMFVWSTSTFIDALARHRPQLRDMLEAVGPSVDGENFAGSLRTEYEKLDRISVDYAIMEKADNIIMAEGTFAWDDLGSWSSLGNYFDRGDSGNLVLGTCEAVDSDDNVVVSEGRLTALVGVHDLVVVQAAGATLVCARERAEEVKKMVRLLAEKGSYEELL